MCSLRYRRLADSVLASRSMMCSSVTAIVLLTSFFVPAHGWSPKVGVHEKITLPGTGLYMNLKELPDAGKLPLWKKGGTVATGPYPAPNPNPGTWSVMTTERGRLPIKRNVFMAKKQLVIRNVINTSALVADLKDAGHPARAYGPGYVQVKGDSKTKMNEVSDFLKESGKVVKSQENLNYEARAALKAEWWEWVDAERAKWEKEGLIRLDLMDNGEEPFFAPNKKGALDVMTDAQREAENATRIANKAAAAAAAAEEAPAAEEEPEAEEEAAGEEEKAPELFSFADDISIPVALVMGFFGGSGITLSVFYFGRKSSNPRQEPLLENRS